MQTARLTKRAIKQSSHQLDLEAMETYREEYLPNEVCSKIKNSSCQTLPPPKFSLYVSPEKTTATSRGSAVYMQCIWIWSQKLRCSLLVLGLLYVVATVSNLYLSQMHNLYAQKHFFNIL